MRDRIVFHHAPKCGGNSVRSAMARHFAPWDRRRMNPAVVRAAIDRSRLPGKLGREALLLYLLARGDHRFIAGHLPFSETAWERHRDLWRFVTVLRRPVDRWFSAYFYRRYTPSHPRRTDLDLESWIETPVAHQHGRRLVRMLCGPVDPEADVDAAVERAIENLGRFDVVGVLEALDSFRKQYRERFGVRLRIAWRNRSPVSKARQAEEITDRIRSRVEEICEPDTRVYRHAVERLVE